MAFEHYGTDTNWSAQQKAADQEKQAEKSEFSNVKFSLNVGTTKLRVMPRYSGEEGKGWMVETYEHFMGGGVQPVVCPTMYDMPCPFCEKRRDLYDEGDEKGAKDLKANHKYWINAIILQEPSKGTTKPLTPGHGVYALKIPAKIRNVLIDMDIDFAADYGDITNLESGFNVFIDRSPENSLDMYTTRLQRTRSNIVTELADMGIDINNFTLVNLDELVQVKSYDELKDIMDNAGAKAPAQAQVAQPAVRLAVTSPKAVEPQEEAPVVAATPAMKVTNPKPVPNIPRPPVMPKRPGVN